MKRFQISPQGDGEYRVTIYRADTCLIDELVFNLTAIEALVGVIEHLSLASQVTDELSRKQERSANTQEREELLAIIMEE